MADISSRESAPFSHRPSRVCTTRPDLRRKAQENRIKNKMFCYLRAG